MSRYYKQMQHGDNEAKRLLQERLAREEMGDEAYSDPAASLTVIGMIEATQAWATGSGPMGELAAGLAPMLAALMGLDNRAFVIDFAEPGVTMVTHEDNGNHITDMVRADCW